MGSAFMQLSSLKADAYLEDTWCTWHTLFNQENIFSRVWMPHRYKVSFDSCVILGIIKLTTKFVKMTIETRSAVT